jgi:putative hydrolase of the HAD superfamily
VSAIQPIELIAFDLGNVLFMVDETNPTAALARLCGRPEAEVFDAVFSPARKALFEGGPQKWEEHVAQAVASLGLSLSEEEFTRTYTTALTPNLPMFPIVERLARRYRLAVASNTSRPHWEFMRAALPCRDLIDPAIISCEVGAMKPDRRFYEALIERSCVPAGRILFIDDRIENVGGASDAGLRAIQFKGVSELNAQLADAGLV